MSYGYRSTPEIEVSAYTPFHFSFTVPLRRLTIITKSPGNTGLLTKIETSEKDAALRNLKSLFALMLLFPAT